MKTATKPSPTQTREEWLRALTAKLAPIFQEVGKPLPDKLRVSVGWPCKKALASGKGRILGQCFATECSADKHTEIFVSPVIGKAMDAAGVLAHELVHAAVGTKAAHRKPFIDCGRAIGLEGKPTQMLPSKELKTKLAAMIDQVGPFPHATLDLTKLTKTKGRKKWIKIVCPSCDYACKTTQKWLDVGLPTCCCGEQMECPDQAGEDEEGDD